MDLFRWRTVALQSPSCNNDQTTTRCVCVCVCVCYVWVSVFLCESGCVSIYVCLEVFSLNVCLKGLESNQEQLIGLCWDLLFARICSSSLVGAKWKCHCDFTDAQVIMGMTQDSSSLSFPQPTLPLTLRIMHSAVVIFNRRREINWVTVSPSVLATFPRVCCPSSTVSRLLLLSVSKSATGANWVGPGSWRLAPYCSLEVHVSKIGRPASHDLPSIGQTRANWQGANFIFLHSDKKLFLAHLPTPRTSLLTNYEQNWAALL